MATTVLYRLNGGEVKGISIADPWPLFPDAFFGKVVDPPTPDGGNLSPRKIYDGTDMRNATAAEITNFAVAESDDENLQARTLAKDLLDEARSVATIKAIKALIELLVDDLNILRQQFNTTTAESAQLTTTTFPDRTVALVKTGLKNKLDSGVAD